MSSAPTILRDDPLAQLAAAGTSTLRPLAAAGAALAALTLLTPFAFRAGGDNAYIALAIPAGLLTLVAARLAERAPVTQALWLILGLAMALRGFLVVLDPLLSSDIYRYVWDGRVQAAGINPYRYFPADQALASLRDQAIYPNVNRAEYAVTIYPPVAQFFFLIVTRIGESVTVMRLALLGCEAGTVVILLLLLRHMGQPLTRVVAYAWHPLPMWEIANSGHIDALMITLMMLGLWLAFTASPLRGAASIALAALVKPIAVLALAAVWRRWDWRAPFVILAVWALCYAPYLSVGVGVFGFLTTGYLTEERFASGDGVWPLAVWRSIFGIQGGDVILYFGVAGLIVGSMALVAVRRPLASIELSVSHVVRLLLAFLFLLSPNYPWYFLVVTPFLALYGGAPAWTASIGALLLQEEAGWDFHIPLMVRKSVLYAAFLLACVYSVWRAQSRRVAGEGGPA
jgi:alpha-1,6-mannosyltransferase